MAWTTLAINSEILAVHIALLSNGKILIFPGDQHRGSATDFQHARLFNPATGFIEPCDPPTTDVFCSGHAFLGDGRLVVGGGTARYGAAGHGHDPGGVSPFSGERSTWLYEPRENRWDRVGDMNFAPGSSGGGGRWYPTLVTLGNGEVMAFSGHPHEPFSDDPRHNNDLPERFSASARGWNLHSTVVLTGSANGNGYYPRLHVLRDGRVFIAMHIQGSSKRIYDPYADALVGPDIADTGVFEYDNFWDGPSVLLPLLPADDYRPRVLMACYQPKIIDLGEANPAWQNTVARALAGEPRRQYANGVILPTGQVLICGGVSNVDADTGVMEPEIYEPGIDWANGWYSPSGGPGPQPSWSAPADPATVVRNYHSVAILMPNGEVWTAGSSKRGRPGDPNDPDFAEKTIEVYSPGYVGQPRPTISAAPDYINYGLPFELETPNAGSIQRVALIRSGSVTHGFDSDQRYVALTFERIGMTNRLRAIAPPHGNIAPPGQYMLWIVDNAGMPCAQAPILRLGQTGSFVLTDRSSFSVHEVEALLTAGSPAVFQNALYFVIEGHLPHEIAAIGGMPSLVLHFDSVSGPVVGANMQVAQNGPMMWEDPDQPADRPQRVTFAFDILFPSAAVFTGINNRQVWVEATWGAHRATARLDLTNQPNPYMIDGPTEWLSTDVRIFRIRRGETRFGVEFRSSDTPFSFLQRMQAFFNTAAGEPQFRAIPEDPDDSPLTLFGTQGGTPVFNFAFAKVRYRALTAQAPNVAVFFRAFNSVGTAIEFDPTTTYARHERPGGAAIPLLGRQGTSLISIPFFGEPRVTPGGSMIDQLDSGNVHTLEPNGANEFQWHYGAYLDINQESEPHFPAIGTGDGPFGGDAQSIKALVRDHHQCLVAEVYFKSPDPMAPPLIVARATPGSSDKLSQRNLAFVRCSNPGSAITRTVHHTFEVKPSDGVPLQVALPQGLIAVGGTPYSHHRLQTRPDELMFRWGNLPRNSMAEVFLPAVTADQILDILSTRPSPGMITKVDEHTVRFRIGDVGYLPIPRGTVNHAGLLTIQLPAGVVHGQVYVVTAHQVSGFTSRLIGAFELRILVRHTNLLLDGEIRRLSLLRWIFQGMSPSDRWRPVFERYLGAIADRVDELGGDSTTVNPSPHEDGSPERPKPNRFCCWALPTLVAFTIVLAGLLPRTLAFAVTAAALVIFIGLWIWQACCCRITSCERLVSLLFGLIVGVGVLAIAGLLGYALALPAVLWGAVAIVVIAVIAVLRKCLHVCDEPCCK